MVHRLHDVFHPKRIAVVGASSQNQGMLFISGMRQLGYKGDILAVNPKYTEVAGVRCVPSLLDIEEEVDYAISCIPASRVLELVDDAAKKRVKTIHFFTAQFGETGRQDAIELEIEVLRRAKEASIRILGPNCMGIYYPAWGLAFRINLPAQPGKVAFISQSGSEAHEIVEMAGLRGIHFSKVVSYGNAIDINETELLEYFAQDDETEIIIMYVEGIRNGPRFVEALRQTTTRKPVLILKGGRGQSGLQATKSHTASLAGSMEIWNAVFQQTGAVRVLDVDDLLDVLAALYFLPPPQGRNVGIAGGSGGVSVLAADVCEEAGLVVTPFSEEFRERLRRQGSEVWDWVGNPCDFSIVPDGNHRLAILNMMNESPDFHSMVLILMLMGPQDFQSLRSAETRNTVLRYILDNRVNSPGGKPVVLVLMDRGQTEKDETGNSWVLLQEAKRMFISLGVPTYTSVARAAGALAAMSEFYEKQEARQNAVRMRQSQDAVSTR